MYYIFTALKAEAQAFVDKFKLTKVNKNTLITFQNEQLCVIVTGIGATMMKEKMLLSIQELNITKDDTVINIGICAAKEEYAIGSFIEFGTIIYENNSYTLNNTELSITCMDTEQSKVVAEFVDMESFGFYEALHAKNLQGYMFKVVSDHFEPHTITKDFTKKLIRGTIPTLQKRFEGLL